MNNKILLGLEIDENKILRSKVAQLRTEIAGLLIDKEREQMLKASVESELIQVQETLSDMSSRITSYTKDLKLEVSA